jgi:predicted TIM-barrel fold metal-dependent hydrolase
VIHGTIDVHGHVTSPELLARLPMPPSLGDIDGMIAQKEAAGIGMTIVGSPVGAGTMVPVPGLDNYDQPADKLEAFHDFVAETVQKHPESLRAYVWTNPYGGDALLERTARRLADDEFVGLIVNSSVRGRYLDEPAADDFWALAAEYRAPVLLHAPAEPVGAAGLGHVGLIEHVARPCDVTLGVAAILAAGWLDRYPDLALIASTGGGALPLLAEKLDLAQRRAGPPGPGGPPPPAPAGTPFSAQLRRVYVDTATPSPLGLAAALATFGPDRLLFGTDSPPLTGPITAALDRVAGLDAGPEVTGQILGGNAAALFRLDGSADD